MTFLPCLSSYSKYAEILAAQGCLETAMGYLMAVNDQVSAVVVCFCTFHDSLVLTVPQSSQNELFYWLTLQWMNEPNNAVIPKTIAGVFSKANDK